MSEHTTSGSDVTTTEEFGHGAVRLDEGHIIGTGGLPAHFENPGMPPHQPRMSDLSEAGAKRAERQVAALFTLSILSTIGFIVSYYAFGPEDSVFIPGIGWMGASNAALGLCLAGSLLGIGLGAVHWAKTLMPDVEMVEERHVMRSTDENRQGVVETLYEGGRQAHLNRRPLLKYSLLGALSLFPLGMAWQLVGGLGRLPHDELSLTFWNGHDGEFKPLRLMRDPEGTAIKAADVTIGSVFHVMPEGLLPDPTSEDERLRAGLEHGILEEKAKAAVLLMRLDPAIIKSDKERAWGHEGIVAYSKICTHVGCPVGLYEQQTHHLLCPCHQSTFDVTDDCKVIFGPAKRPLPQLKITVDDEGYLIATQPFREAVGPSFWERG